MAEKRVYLLVWVGEDGTAYVWDSPPTELDNLDTAELISWKAVTDLPDYFGVESLEEVLTIDDVTTDEVLLQYQSYVDVVEGGNPWSFWLGKSAFEHPSKPAEVETADTCEEWISKLIAANKKEG